MFFLLKDYNMFGFLKKLFAGEPVVSAKTIAEFMKKEKAIILDVRTKKEFQTGHIRKCKHIPVSSISNKITQIKSWDKPVIVYCRSGQRAGLAAKILKANGIKVLNGGGYETLKKIVR